MPHPPAPNPSRGSVWWVAFDPARGAEIQKTRPAVVLTANGLNRSRRTVVVVPLSTGPVPRRPVIVPLASLAAESVAVCDQLRAMDKSRLISVMGTLSREDLRAVEDGVRAVLAL